MDRQRNTAKKYLLFSMDRHKTGMDTVFRMLNLIFKEARHLNRIPVIGKFTMSPTHNLGNSRSDLNFDDYLDLSNSITYQLKEGCHRPIASHLVWIKEEDLDLRAYFFDKIYFLSDEEIVTEEMNNHYDVLIRRDPSFQYTQTHKRYKSDNVLIDFPYSEKVNELTDEVLDILGTSREHAMTAQHYFLSRFNNAGRCDDMVPNMSKRNIPLNASYYACMHARASINDRDYEQPIFTFGSSRIQIKTVLNEAVAKGSQLYIMSDIHQSDFFDFLKSDYQIYRYHDFPLLKRLVSGEDSAIDNVMLYLVEKNIMKYATVKILPPHKGPMIYHLNTVYNLSLLKNPPVKRAYSMHFKKTIGACIQKLGLRHIFSSIMSG